VTERAPGPWDLPPAPPPPAQPARFGCLVLAFAAAFVLWIICVRLTAWLWAGIAGLI
jgi:hypothetical protein